MIITDVLAVPLRYEMPIPMADAIHYMPARESLLVLVHTDVGIVGRGEAASYGGALASVASVVEGELRSQLIGADPFTVERIWQRAVTASQQRGRNGTLLMALSGVDIALWDIVGQVCRTPLFRLFGGFRESVPAYASAGFYAENKDSTSLAEEVGAYVERGFTGVKIKVGRQPEALLNPLMLTAAEQYATVSFDEDVERVRAARRAVGKRTKLAIDANNAWTPSDTLRFMEQIREEDIYWLEEPTSNDDIEGSRHIAERLNIPVAGYESLIGLGAFRDLIGNRAVDIVQPDVIWSGGFTEVRKIAALAEAAHLPVIPHVFSSALSLVANLHLIASISNGSWLEWDQNPNPLRTDLLDEPLLLTASGRVAAPTGPGLGVTIDHRTVNRFRVGGSELSWEDINGNADR
jgi:D-arabinonate dehydratase